MRFFRSSVAIACLVLSGCVSLSPETQKFLCSAIDYALSETPDVIKNQADAGNHHAQLSYAVVLRYGLNHTPINVAEADVYRDRAIQPVRMNTNFIWIAGSKKIPGHMMPVTTPIYEVSPLEAKVVDECLALLTAPAEPADQEARLTKGICGGADNYTRLKDNWQSVAPKS